MAATTPAGGRAPASAFSETTVAAVFHPGVIACPATAALRHAATTMVANRVHCLVVEGSRNGGDEPVWDVLDDVDLARALADPAIEPETALAGDYAKAPPVTVATDEPLRSAAARMWENGVTHALVVDDAAGRLLGIVSCLDLARAVAGRA